MVKEWAEYWRHFRKCLFGPPVGVLCQAVSKKGHTLYKQSFQMFPIRPISEVFQMGTVLPKSVLTVLL